MISALMLSLILAVPMGPAPDLPPAAAGLAALLEDEPAFVNAVRAFDNLQEARAELLIRRARALNPEGDEERVDRLMREAYALVDEVARVYDFALYYYENNPRLLAYQGELYSDWLGQEQLAALNWQRALAANSKLAAAHANLGMQYCARGQLRLGLDHLDQALKLDPKNPDLHFNLVQVYIVDREGVQRERKWNAQKLYDRMIRASRKAVSLAPRDFQLRQDYAVNLMAADRFGAKPDWKAAARAWQEARPLAPGMQMVFYAWLNEARSWLWAGERERADRCLVQALRIDPEHRDARIMLDGIRSGAKF